MFIIIIIVIHAGASVSHRIAAAAVGARQTLQAGAGRWVSGCGMHNTLWFEKKIT